MPTIETDINVSIDVEVFCNTCGAGLCFETTVKGHQYPQFRVNACPDCMNKKDEEIKRLTELVDKLEDKISTLKSTM